jgi:hypothetical protein
MHLLHIFDANGRSPDAVQQTSLEDSLLSMHWDVNAASYSPDGVYLVVSRSDNIAHVYDSRMLPRGPLHALEHLGPKRNQPGMDTYGIQGTQWVETPARRKLGLVTGGVDGIGFPLDTMGILLMRLTDRVCSHVGHLKIDG